MFPWRRALGVVEVALYASLFIISDWFADGQGYVARDPLVVNGH